MEIVLMLFAVAIVLWAIVALPHLRLWCMTIGVILVAYPLGHTFWHQKFGPLTLTIDRVLIVGVAVLLIYRWRAGGLRDQPWRLVDWVLLAWLGWLSLSAIVSLPDDPLVLPTSPLGRLTFSFWIPALLYLSARHFEHSSRASLWMLASLAVLGTYLGVTGIAEVTEQWWAVFPRYIADPDLGLHFGRARGPSLNSVCLGFYLTVCLWAAWSLMSHVSRGWQLTLVGCVMIMAAAIVATQTRSVWLGLVVSAIWMMYANLSARLRMPITLIACLAGGALVIGAKGNLVGMERENSVGDAAHSVQQRAAFAYVSWHMMQDHPLWGVGFGRFYDQKMPYLQDRRQSFELESIRDLHHHNTFLSFATETGLMGIAGFLAILASWTAYSWRLSFDNVRPAMARDWGRLAVAVVLAYLPSAAFHDVTLLPQMQWLLYFVAGGAMSLAVVSQPVTEVDALLTEPTSKWLAGATLQ